MRQKRKTNEFWNRGTGVSPRKMTIIFWRCVPGNKRHTWSQFSLGKSGTNRGDIKSLHSFTPPPRVDA
jgi:hypothetical protein